MRGALGIAALVLASAGAMAQANAAPATMQFKLQEAGSGCPVQVSAQRRAVGEVSWAGAAAPRGHGQGLALTFNRQGAPKIEKVKLTVYGLGGEGRVIFTNVPAHERVTESFVLVRPRDAGSLLESKIWTSRMNVVQRVELNSISYTDGSVWVASEKSKCITTPNDILLVASR